MQPNYLTNASLHHAHPQPLIDLIRTSKPRLRVPICSGTRGSDGENKNGDDNGGKVSHFGSATVASNSAPRIWSLLTILRITVAGFGSQLFTTLVGIGQQTNTVDPASATEAKATTDQNCLYAHTGKDQNDDVEPTTNQRSTNLLTLCTGFQFIDFRKYLRQYCGIESPSQDPWGNYWHARTRRSRRKRCASQERPQIILRRPLSWAVMPSLMYFSQAKKTLLRKTRPQRKWPWKNFEPVPRLHSRADSLFDESIATSPTSLRAVFPRLNVSTFSNKETAGVMGLRHHFSYPDFYISNLKFLTHRHFHIHKRGHL